MPTPLMGIGPLDGCSDLKQLPHLRTLAAPRPGPPRLTPAYPPACSAEADEVLGSGGAEAAVVGLLEPAVLPFQR